MFACLLEPWPSLLWALRHLSCTMLAFWICTTLLSRRSLVRECTGMTGPSLLCCLGVNLGKKPSPFFPWFFRKHHKENIKNTKDFSHRANPQKSCKISRKHSKRPRKFPGRKHQGNKNSKEKNDRELPLTLILGQENSDKNSKLIAIRTISQQDSPSTMFAGCSGSMAAWSGQRLRITIGF